MRPRGLVMFKLIGRTSSTAHLGVFRDYIKSSDANPHLVRQSIALLMRGAFKEVGLKDFAGEDKAKFLDDALLSLSISLPDEIAKTMAAQLLDTSHRQKKIMGITPGHYANTFLAGFFQMMGQSPDVRVMAKNSGIGKINKDFKLFEEFFNEMTKLFKGHEDMLLTDIVQEDLPEFIKNM